MQNPGIILYFGIDFDVDWPLVEFLAETDEIFFCFLLEHSAAKAKFFFIEILRLGLDV
jgi:hypothetical protein